MGAVMGAWKAREGRQAAEAPDCPEARRTYGDACAAAHALDVIGERWALLVVRELLLGPKRFTDVRQGLPKVSPNVLGQRLRELEQDGVVRRRRLGPPAGAWVYELTDWGRQLERVLSELGRWGLRSPAFGRPRPGGPGDTGDAGDAGDASPRVSVDSLMLALRSLLDPAACGDLRATYQLRFAEDALVVRIAEGRIDVRRGETPDPDAALETDPQTFAALLARRSGVDEVIARGDARVTGTPQLVQRLFELFPLPLTATN